MARYDQDNTPYSWMPGFLRRFLNLDYDEPQSGGGSSYAQAESRSYAPATEPASRSTWSPPNDPTFKATSMESYTPPAGSGFAPPPPAPRPDSGAAPASVAAPAAQLPFDNAVQPFTYLVRAWFYGMMPPQGIGTFSKELRATSTDVWNLYSHWARFQTADVFGFGRGVLKTITDILPTSSTSAPVARRIKVTIANGNGSGNEGQEAAAAAPADQSKS